jgi:hypothetical protein
MKYICLGSFDEKKWKRSTQAFAIAVARLHRLRVRGRHCAKPSDAITPAAHSSGPVLRKNYRCVPKFAHAAIGARRYSWCSPL